MATTDFTNSVTLTDAAWFDDVDSAAYAVLSGVAGTNTITATGPATYSYAATRVPVWFTPANTNTGATTINVTPSGGSALGAKNIFWNGAACVGGELRQNVPCAVIYDGTQYHIIANGFNAPFSDAHPVVVGSADATKKVRFEVDGLTTGTTRVITMPDSNVTLGDGLITILATQATTSGTTKDFTIPAGAKEVTVSFVGCSSNSTSNWLVQLGDAGGIETTGYVASAWNSTTGGIASTAGFIVTPAFVATDTLHGQLRMTLVDAATFTWSYQAVIYRAGTDVIQMSSGTKSLSAELTTVRVTTVSADTMDAGLVGCQHTS